MQSMKRRASQDWRRFSTVMIYTHAFNGVTAKTGDILFTRDGDPGSLFGKFWRLIGRLFPSDYSHAALYLGPGVRFIESAAKGVEVVEFQGDTWDSTSYGKERLLVDQLIGIGDPVAGRGISPAREIEIRENVVAYCMEQARTEKPYNIDFFNPDTDGAFYCSQLIYKAYKAQGINLHVEIGEDADSPFASIVLPEDLWAGCHVKARIDGGGTNPKDAL